VLLPGRDLPVRLLRPAQPAGLAVLHGAESVPEPTELLNIQMLAEFDFLVCGVFCFALLCFAFVGSFLTLSGCVYTGCPGTQAPTAQPTVCITSSPTRAPTEQPTRSPVAGPTAPTNEAPSVAGPDTGLGTGTVAQSVSVLV
jgi:hypothetical protein